MAPDTFYQFFKYRSHCLCGKELTTIFNHSFSNDDEYTTINPLGSYHFADNNSTIKFPCHLESRSSPYGEVDFTIVANVSSPSIKLLAEFSQPHLTKVTISPGDFVKKHFTEEVQKKFNINIIRKCTAKIEKKSKYGNLMVDCPLAYSIVTKSILFDFNKKEIVPINFLQETFVLSDDKDHHYRFNTNFDEGVTKITYSVPVLGFVLGGQETLEMPAEKFLKYPLDREFLLNKVKTLLLFS